MSAKRKTAAAFAAAILAAAALSATAQAEPAVGDSIGLYAGTYLWSGPGVDDAEIAKLMDPMEAEVTGEREGARFPVKVGVIDGYVDAVVLERGSAPGAATYDEGQAQALREDVVNYAMRFVGNPYVWGGTSLTNGADCSGFVQSVFADHGVALPRTSQEQGGFGTRKEIADAKAGDLIMYSNGGDAYHVAIYLGDGMTVQAANSNEGIVTKEVGAGASWAVDVIG